MTETLTIALAQLNPTVGDVDGNADRLLAARDEAAAGGADLVVYSELVLIGYPPEDLVLKPALIERVERAIERLAQSTGDGGPAMLVGAPWRDDGKLYNAAYLLADGGVAAVRPKHDLPNYGVFDEKRVFAAGPLPGPVSFRGVRLGVMLCEDMWTEDVGECLDESGAEIMVVINGSPFEIDKLDQRLGYAVARVHESRRALIYVNQVGAPGGRLAARREQALHVAVDIANRRVELRQRDGERLGHRRRYFFSSRNSRPSLTLGSPS